MLSKPSVNYPVLSIFVLFAIVGCIVIDLGTRISAQPTASIENLFASSNKLDDSTSAKLATLSKEAAEQSFQQFISLKPQESTVIGEIKPNASDLEKMLLRTKIASTIQNMQAMEKQQQQHQPHQHQQMPKALNSVVTNDSSGAASVTSPQPSAECYIEVTRVDKVPGKCHRASSGLPICQSENYMTISAECS